MNKLLKIVLAVFSSMIINQSYASDLGVYGQVYPIAEPDMVDFIHQRLDALDKNGQLAAANQKLKENTIAHVMRPEPVKGVNKAIESNTFYYDPTFVLSHNIFNDKGALIAAQGTQINPLKRIHLNEALIFINGDDAQELSFAKQTHSHFNKQGRAVKIILINGNMKEVSESIGRVYFDQNGILCSRFGIKHVPAVVTQEGLKLKIEEHAL